MDAIYLDPATLWHRPCLIRARVLCGSDVRDGARQDFRAHRLTAGMAAVGITRTTVPVEEQGPSGLQGLLHWQRALLIPLTVLAWTAVALIAFSLLGHLVKTVLTLVLAAIVAFALTPLVRFLERWMPKPYAIAVTYVLGFSIILGTLALVLVTAATQITILVGAIPGYATHIQHQEGRILRILHPFGVTRGALRNAEHQAVAALQGVGTSVAKDSLSILTGILGTIVDVILVLILSVYLTANGTKIADQLRRDTPRPYRRHMETLIQIVNQVVGGYIRGQLLLALLIGTLVGAGMYLLHVPYAILLGILAFFMEFIPVMGVLISGAVCVAIALTQGWITAVLVLAYFVFVHIIEGDVVGPRIMGKAVGIHPGTAIVALVAGTELFGIWGALFAAPLAGLIQALLTAAWREYRAGAAGPETRAVVEEVVTQPEEVIPQDSRPISSHAP